jgi:hypothetical protein
MPVSRSTMAGRVSFAIPLPPQQNFDQEICKAMSGRAISWWEPLGNQVRRLLRPFDIRLPSRQGTKKFAEAAHQAVRRDNMLA